MDREGRQPVVGDSAVAEEAMEDDGSSSPAAAEAMDDDGASLSPAAAEAMHDDGASMSPAAAEDDGGSSSPSSYIRLVQHLIEKCICYNMNKEECVVTLEKHANIQPVITSTVWKELEKENREFFETYKKDRSGEEESTHKNPSDEQSSAPTKSSDDDNDDEEEQQPSAPKSSDPTTTTTSSLPLPTRAETTTTRSSLPLPRAQKTTTTRNYGAQHAWYYGTYI